MKRISVDLPDDVYKTLMKIQFDEFNKSGKKPSLRDIINNLIEEGLSKKATS